MYRYVILCLLVSCSFAYVEGQDHNSPGAAQEGPSKYRDAQRRQGTFRRDEQKLAAAGTLPINVTLEVPQESIIPGENFPIRFTIHNPHQFAVYFPHIGYEYPYLYAAVGEEELWFVGRAGGAHPSAVISPVLEQGESATAELLIFIPFTALDRFEPEGGYTLRLRAGGSMHGFGLDGDTDERTVFHCRSEEVRIPVRVPTLMEEEALAALRHWRVVTSPQMIQDKSTRGSRKRARIEFYLSFLERFGDTAYAGEVQSVLARRLQQHVERHRREKEVVDQYEPLLVRSVMNCLGRGPAYAPVVPSWGSGMLEHFGMRGQWNDLIDVIEALLKFSQQDRTLDSVLADISRSVVPIELLQEHGLPEGTLSKRLEIALLRTVERCLSWEGYRAVGFSDNTFEMVSQLGRWDLVEQAAKQTLEAAERPMALKGIAGNRYTVRDEDILAARNALEEVREARNRNEHAREE